MGYDNYKTREEGQRKSREYYLRTKEAHIRRAAEWKRAHPEEWKAFQKETLRKWKEKYAIRAKEYRRRVRKEAFDACPRDAWVKEKWKLARERAKKLDLPFEIDAALHLPDTCPVLGLELQYMCLGRGRPHPDSPSLDRIVPSKGYVPGNVRVISYRANSIRSNATTEELQKVLKYSEECDGHT